MDYRIVNKTMSTLKVNHAFEGALLLAFQRCVNLDALRTTDRPVSQRITKLLSLERFPYLAVTFYHNSNYVHFGEEYILPIVFVKITFTSHSISQKQRITCKSTCEFN